MELNLEIRIYVWIVLLLMVALVFGVLRLYNAMVQNTRQLIASRERLSKHVTELHKVTNKLDEAISDMKTVASNSDKVLTLVAQLVKAMFIPTNNGKRNSNNKVG